jgi:hypothetical protein
MMAAGAAPGMRHAFPPATPADDPVGCRSLSKPSHHTKQTRREHVPLSEVAQALVRTVLETAL